MTPTSDSSNDLIRGAMSTSFRVKPRKAFGYSFVTTTDIRTMGDKLNANTRWTWSLRVNDTYGDYLVARPIQGQDYARVRLFRLESGRHHLDVLCVGTPATSGAWETLDKEINDMLRQIGAWDIKEAGHFD
jgi:hypothetical protein